MSRLLYLQEVAVPRRKLLVNLDALIPRADMALGKPLQLNKYFAFSHHELKFSSTGYDRIKKPDFQRPTSQWTPEKVRDIVEAYVTGELIPSIIVWRSPSAELFIIDGAHRLSSIIAWINDDYGDRDKSRNFLGPMLADEAAEAGNEARDLTELAVGKYSRLSEKHLDATPKEVENRTKLVDAVVSIQDLRTDDPNIAEKSFFKINEQGVALTDVEKWLSHARACPNAIAARAINQKSAGHPFWEKFSLENRGIIEKVATEIYDLIFKPDIEPGSIKTDNLPIGGNYSPQNSLSLIFQMVNCANDISTSKPPTNKQIAETLVPADSSGGDTVRFLRKTKRLALLLSNRANTHAPYSLDLHPFVYFYSGKGHHQPSVFTAVCEWAHTLDKMRQATNFLTFRHKVEDFIVENRSLASQLNRKGRGEEGGVKKTREYLQLITEHFRVHGNDVGLLDSVKKKFKIVPEVENDLEPGPGSRFSVPTKSQIFITEELDEGRHCEICLSRLPSRGISFDHKQLRSHQGAGNKDNYQNTHHACNTARPKLEGNIVK